MKRGRKIILATIGIPAVVAGVVLLDIVLRAGSVITAHETRLAADIAALRIRQQPSPLLLPEEIQKLPRFTYEEGHTGQKLVGETILPTVHLPTGSADEILESLARAQEILLETGLVHGPQRFTYENFFLDRLRAELGKALDGAPRLRRTATLLDQLVARRLTSEDLFMGEHILDRAEILNALQKGHPSLGKPGWRELYSRWILAAKRLNQLDDRSGPDARRELLREERRNRAQWRLTRAAIGVMIHHRERGSLPEEMDGLKMAGVILQDADGSLEWTFPTH